MHIIRKSINCLAQKENSIFRLNKLKEELQINSIDEITSDSFLGLFPITLIIPKKEELETIENKEKLNLLIRFF